MIMCKNVIVHGHVYMFEHRLVNNPQRQHFFKFFFSCPALCMPFSKLIDTGVPGLDHYFSGFKAESRGTY